MMAFNVGSIVGYTLSGVMIATFGWRSIFLINGPSAFLRLSGVITG